jgi:predicted RNA-binding protein YlxR (DUF448 family)
MKTSKLDNISQPLKQKHVPLRTCIACRQSTGKRDLVRLVSSAGGVEVDIKGRKPGRGVYLCARQKCWETGLKSNRIEFGLRTKLSIENRQLLLDYGRSLPEKED